MHVSLFLLRGRGSSLRCGEELAATVFFGVFRRTGRDRQCTRRRRGHAHGCRGHVGRRQLAPGQRSLHRISRLRAQHDAARASFRGKLCRRSCTTLWIHSKPTHDPLSVSIHRIRSREAERRGTSVRTCTVRYGTVSEGRGRGMDACGVRRGRGGWNGCTWMWKTPKAAEGAQGSGGSLGRVGVGAREKAGPVTSARLWMDGREVLSTNANLPTRPTTRETYVAFLPSHVCRAMHNSFLLVGNLSDDDHVPCHACPGVSLRVPSRKLSTSTCSAACPKVHGLRLCLVEPSSISTPSMERILDLHASRG